jgi:outer membrane protein insertion porin family
LRTTRAEPSRCSDPGEPRSRRRTTRPTLAPLLLASLCHLVAARAAAQQEPGAPAPQPEQPSTAQRPPQDPQPPQQPGVRVDPGAQRPGAEVLFDPAIGRMQGKTVRSVTIERAQSQGVVRPLDPQAAESLVRGLQTRVGQPFDAAKITADCGNLWTERRVVVAAFATEVDGEIAVRFELRLEVEIYAGIEFVGLQALDRATVDGLLGLYPDRQVTSTEAEAMRKVLLARYRRDGYAHCSIRRVEVESADAATAPPDAPRSSKPQRLVRFVIDEGPKVTVGRIDFIGNVSFPSNPMLGLFGAADYLLRDARIDSGPARGLVSGGAYSREVLEEDLDKLRLFYRSRGFLDATVDLVDVVFTPDRDVVDLTFAIVEGPRYRVRSVRVEHVTPGLTPGARQPLPTPPLYSATEIEQELRVRPGEFYDHDRLQRDVLAIQDFYGRRGHPPASYPGMANVPSPCEVYQPTETYGTAPEVDLVFQVSEGVPKTLRDVVIRGNRFTRDHVIRRRFKVFPGERIDMVDVRRSLQGVQQTRYFQDPTNLIGPRLQLEPVPGQVDQVDLGLDVTDGPTGQLRWGIGISTGQGVQAQFTLNKANFDITKLPSSADPITVISEILDNKAFHGGGQNLSLLLAPGTDQSQFQLTFVEPDIFGQHIDTWEARASGNRLIQRLPDGYTSDKLGAQVGLAHNFTDHFQVGFSLGIESVEVDDLAADATSLAYDAEGQTELRRGRLTARYRDYDDPIRPTSGYELSLSGDLVGGPFGGEESLTKLTHTANLYAKLAENEAGHRTVLHLEQFLGIANEFGGSDDVFLTERFYLGGANLRGFDYRDVGPKQFDRPTGGEAMWNSSIEVFFPLVSTRLEGEVRDRELLRWLVFTDFGLLGLDWTDPTFRELRAASGIGLRIEIPVLEVPIALDLGWPWLYEDTDGRRQLYFSISR